MLVHHTFKFPNLMQDQNISKTIQEISLRKNKYNEIQYDYRQRLLYDINRYYSSHTELIGGPNHLYDIRYIQNMKNRSYENLTNMDRTGLIYFYRLNNGNYCPLCGNYITIIMILMGDLGLKIIILIVMVFGVVHHMDLLTLAFVMQISHRVVVR